MSSNPCRARLRIWIWRTELSPIGSSGFGMTCVNGLSRAPRPPARMTAFIDPCSDVVLGGPARRALTPEPLHGFSQAALQRIDRLPVRRFHQQAVVTHQPIDFAHR